MALVAGSGPAYAQEAIASVHFDGVRGGGVVCDRRGELALVCGTGSVALMRGGHVVATHRYAYGRGSVEASFVGEHFVAVCPRDDGGHASPDAGRLLAWDLRDDTDLVVETGTCTIRPFGAQALVARAGGVSLVEEHAGAIRVSQRRRAPDRFLGCMASLGTCDLADGPAALRVRLDRFGSLTVEPHPEVRFQLVFHAGETSEPRFVDGRPNYDTPTPAHAADLGSVSIHSVDVADRAVLLGTGRGAVVLDASGIRHVDAIIGAASWIGGRVVEGAAGEVAEVGGALRITPQRLPPAHSTSLSVAPTPYLRGGWLCGRRRCVRGHAGSLQIRRRGSSRTRRIDDPSISNIERMAFVGDERWALLQGAFSGRVIGWDLRTGRRLFEADARAVHVSHGAIFFGEGDRVVRLDPSGHTRASAPLTDVVRALGRTRRGHLVVLTETSLEELDTSLAIVRSIPTIEAGSALHAEILPDDVVRVTRSDGAALLAVVASDGSVLLSAEGRFELLGEAPVALRQEGDLRDSQLLSGDEARSRASPGVVAAFFAPHTP